MHWYKKVIKENKTKIYYSALYIIVSSLAVLLWYFALGKSYNWQEIEPLSAPSLLYRMFYSALVFVTFGAFLYKIKFYQNLHYLFVRSLRKRRLYKDIKKIIWWSLIGLMYVIVVKIFDFINAIVSFLYNILGIILYLLPPLGVSLILSIIAVYCYKRIKDKI
jgi:hypothetical protein